MPGQGLTTAAIAAVILFTGCAGEATESCRQPGQDYPLAAVSISEARERDGELVTVRGALIARGGHPEQLCTDLSDDTRPSCRGPMLKVAGLRDASAFEDGESEGDTAWWASVTMAGRIDGGTVRYELSCRAEDVQRHLGEAIGKEPGFNAFASNAEVERLDYAPLPGRMPSGLRDEYGVFGVSVRVDDETDPLLAFELLDEPDARGIGWFRENDRWFAVKRYGDDVVLIWLAGSEKRVDERWERLDKILRDLD